MDDRIVDRVLQLEEFEPCPFCGAVNLTMTHSVTAYSPAMGHCIGCIECGACGPRNPSPQEAIRLWSGWKGIDHDNAKRRAREEICAALQSKADKLRSEAAELEKQANGIEFE